MSDKPLLVVATPCFGGQVTSVYADSMLRLQSACRASGIGFTWFLGSGDALITRVRADLMTAFLDMPEATHFLFIDADIWFEPPQVFRLMNFAEDFVAAAYPLKMYDWDKIARAMAERRPKPICAALHYVFNLEDPAKVVSRQGFAKSKYVGTGFMMLRRAALLRLCEANPQLKYKKAHVQDDRLNSPHRYALFDTMIDPETGEYLSEDYAFCRRWRDIGGEIWVDLQSKLTHVGPTGFVGDLSAQFDPVR